MGYLLVTNDDGVDSPALVPLIRALSQLREVRVVVPAEERSWVSKAISRWDRVRVRHVERGGHEILAVEGGFPADCTNLAVHSLFDEPPELVVSGVNIGLNSGLGFFLSSGTVGAAVEGWIAGLGAIAFSVGRSGSDGAWKRSVHEDGDELWQRAAALSADIVRHVLEAGYPDGVDLLNVNFPVEAHHETQRVVTQLAVVGYGRLFSPVEDAGADDVFEHDFDGELRGATPREGTDVAVLRSGRVSITPVRLAHASDLPDDLRRRFERGSPE
ncbi:MAG: 5'/3'-nucleotidase SurE [Deltaproteobacteria bacterium]|nr:5'/3'-nucleotidase SurE [Deltaproteobacteria bacterium]MBW2413595.1 5'/3'-nucleotidase SurE [Deltaproteobacteria bacterium]